MIIGDMTMEEMFGRKIALKALVGSHNYNLNTPASDKDYKFFVFPTFDDLYTGKMFSTAQQSETLDFDCHDVRQLGNLIWKANINFVEVLFSKELKFDARLADIFLNPDSFAEMNLVAFFNATYGMHIMKMKDLYKGTAKTAPLVEQFGYDTKQACHALRCLYVLDRYVDNLSMGRALWFSSNTYEHQILSGVKAGKFLEAEFRTFVTRWHELHFARVKEFFMAQSAHEEEKVRIDNIIKNAIKSEIGAKK
jgi:hypothetical protein